MRGFFGQGFMNMSLDSFAQFHGRPACRLLHAQPARSALRTVAVCAALALTAMGCGSSDPDDASGDPGGGVAGPGAGGGQQGGGGVGGAFDAGTSPVTGGGGPATPGNDTSIQTSLDGGMPIPVEPPKPLADASVMGPPLGSAYAETEYKLERPLALVAAYEQLTSNVSSATRLFVNHLHIRDGAPTVAYGAADVTDGGLVWQSRPMEPNTFPIGVAGDRMFVSDPFKYVLEARIPNPANAASVFRLGLGIEQAVWSAAFSADYEEITTGAIYGVLTRAEAESRAIVADPLGAAAACATLCSDIFACGERFTLASLLDCNGAMRDVDIDGNGTDDGYRVIFSFKSRRVAPPVN